MPSPPEPGLCAHLACLWEATARKAGNVYPGCGFADVCWMDFALSAAAVAPVFAGAPGRPVGAVVLGAIRATRAVVSTNTNLGIVLLLAPLAAAWGRNGVNSVLDTLDVQDARDVYAAIRLAHPGGLGEVPEQDVRDEPTLTLREAMALAQDRDSIARQYVNDFRDIFDGAAILATWLSHTEAMEDAIIATHLELMARHPDSLIVRKRDVTEAEEAGRRARGVLDAGWPHAETGRRAFAELDAWLRADGHARNPGTSADLVTACIFVALRDNDIRLPLALPWSRG